MLNKKENDICDGEKGCFILNFVSMFRRAARCAYRTKMAKSL